MMPTEINNAENYQEVDRFEEHAYENRFIKCQRTLTNGKLCNHMKETAHMQLWTDEGFRNVWCRGCQKQSRAQTWWCLHEKPWRECSIHRIDPDEHRTNKAAPKAKGQAVVRMLPYDRPEPAEKKARTARMSEAKRKLIVQSAHPHKLVQNAVNA